MYKQHAHFFVLIQPIIMKAKLSDNRKKVYCYHISRQQLVMDINRLAQPYIRLAIKNIVNKKRNIKKIT